MNSGSPDTPKGRPALSEAALFGLCPECGGRTLFAGWIKLAPRCRVCSLDYDQFNVGDGPAAFLTLLIGALVVGLAAWLVIAVDPPWWVHVLLWVPLSIGLTIGGLRVAKAALLTSEYRNSAREAGTKDL
ncbi:DUF983 domain-containing protein [Parerythrobacter aestuarii]|uniref:DUF983 domain-containing protein n=1 Tax=Parerythrobacter aestuarii TaxID=3020909 RepID=UPI0024DE65AF|nr:DUF983 domain-containing protein [Parerythrobacter aestuarii]